MDGCESDTRCDMSKKVDEDQAKDRLDDGFVQLEIDHRPGISVESY